MAQLVTRRGFLVLFPLLLAPRIATAGAIRRLRGAAFDPVRHPEPRPGITAARVLPASTLRDRSAAVVFDMVREIPEQAS